MKNLITLFIFVLSFLDVSGKSTPRKDSLLTFGHPDNFEVSYGKLTFGALPPQKSSVKANNINFSIQSVKKTDDGYIVYGSRNKDGVPKVFSAFTSDGYSFSDTKILFEVPPSLSGTPWLTSQVTLGGDSLFLMLCARGIPQMAGHFFYGYKAGQDGTNWRSIKNDYLYRGQDALKVVWNNKLGKFVNYHTSYQKYNKRFPDNLPDVRRVMHIRSSPDGLNWAPGGSFGASGPYLSVDQLILPDSLDYEDTEFYKLSVINMGEFWAGIMVKYSPKPPEIPIVSPWPHGPFLEYEWWISGDGLDWKRPFRENSALDDAAYHLAYGLTDPIQVNNELRWLAGANEIFTLDRNRMFYAYCKSNAEIITKPIKLSGAPLSLQVDFFERDKTNSSPLNQALKKGYLIAELLDDKGVVIPGFERSKCIFQTSGDKTLTLKWGDNLFPANYKQSPVQLRILFRDMRLYSLAY